MQGVGSVEIGGSVYFKLDSALAVRARPGMKRNLENSDLGLECSNEALGSGTLGIGRGQ
jgi:hypothetical protein